jgi:hypothetical protein
MAVIPELHYDRVRGAPKGKSGGPAGSALARRIEKVLQSRWGDGGGIVHVHNPLIQKNSGLLGALRELGGRGFSLLLQNHDLAEDFRPDVYSGESYPENCHYAVINSRDFAFLRDAGLKPGIAGPSVRAGPGEGSPGLYLLPNEVRPLTVSPPAGGGAGNRYLYPVRGIRRKNLGEALLLSLFIPRGRTVAITQPPTTGRDQDIYRHWKKIAGELSLPVEFEIGRDRPFPEVLGTACAVITSSVKEGFGFSFLEPWTAGLAVTGRRIDYVCRDFEDAGVHFDALYNSLLIPPEFAPPELFKEKFLTTLTGVYGAFGMEAPPGLEAKIAELAFRPAGIDFGAMDEAMQSSVIRAAAGDGGVRRTLAEANPFLEGLAGWEPCGDRIEANRGAVTSAYSREAVSVLLRNMYEAVKIPVKQRISRSRLLELYLDPRRVYLPGIAYE